MIVVVFGLAGAGKNYVGQLLSQETGCYFWDADEAITEEMMHCIKTKNTISQEIRDHYFNIVMERAKALQLAHGNVIIAQAFYKNKNRQEFIDRFSETLFVHVSASLDVILPRLKERNDMIDGEYAKKISTGFEQPNHPCALIHNDAESNKQTLVMQLRGIPKLSALFPDTSAVSAHYTNTNSLLIFAEVETNPQKKQKALVAQTYTKSNIYY